MQPQWLPTSNPTSQRQSHADAQRRNACEIRLQFDTPTICNVIELFEVRPQTDGYMDATIKACFPEMPPIAGFAATATFRSAGALHGSETYSSLDDQVFVSRNWVARPSSSSRIWTTPWFRRRSAR
ncbi:MAG: hypothetical protein R2856_12935 [Caldilineaceae bacterium]